MHTATLDCARPSIGSEIFSMAHTQRQHAEKGIVTEDCGLAGFRNALNVVLLALVPSYINECFCVEEPLVFPWRA
jgi:hypothetical protein